MQNLLLQGSVPVTMLFSLFLLKSYGDDITRVARGILQSRHIYFTEQYAGDDRVEDARLKNTSVVRITVNGTDMGNIPSILKDETPPDPDPFARLGIWLEKSLCGPKRPDRTSLGQIQETDLHNVTLFQGSSADELRTKSVVLISDSPSWGHHFWTFDTIAQYMGAAVILTGLVVSVWPSLIKESGGAGLIGWELIFFSSTIPIALSGVYKEMGFKACDLDVWYLNGYVAIWQFVLGLLYAPLAAVMTGLAISDIPLNIWQGLQCWLLGTNFITRERGFDCSIALECGTGGNKMCCDSCDGSIPTISSLRAIWGVLFYMIFNIAYNVFLVLVIKHGSAALMYATSTVVLPLGSIAFIIPAFMGQHAIPFDVYTGIGLAVVLIGLVIYRFGDLLIRNYWAKQAKRRQEIYE